MQKCDAHDGVIAAISELKIYAKLGIGVLLFSQLIIAPILTSILQSGFAKLAKQAEACDGGYCRASSQLPSFIGKEIDISHKGDSDNINRGSIPQNTPDAV